MSPSTHHIHHLPFSDFGKLMLGVGLVLLVSCAVLLVSTERHLETSNKEVQRANAALMQIAEIDSLIIGIDYSARGYALTGQPLFLYHENSKQARLKAAVANLAALVDQDQYAEIKSLAKLVEIDAKVYADFVKLGPGRTKEIASIITDPVDRKKRYDVLAALKRIHEDQLNDLKAYQADSEKQHHQSALLMFLIVGIAFLGGTTDIVVRIIGGRKLRARQQ